MSKQIEDFTVWFDIEDDFYYPKEEYENRVIFAERGIWETETQERFEILFDLLKQESQEFDQDYFEYVFTTHFEGMYDYYRIAEYYIIQDLAAFNATIDALMQEYINYQTFNYVRELESDYDISAYYNVVLPKLPRLKKYSSIDYITRVPRQPHYLFEIEYRYCGDIMSSNTYMKFNLSQEAQVLEMYSALEYLSGSSIERLSRDNDPILLVYSDHYIDEDNEAVSDYLLKTEFNKTGKLLKLKQDMNRYFDIVYTLYRVDGQGVKTKANVKQ